MATVSRVTPTGWVVYDDGSSLSRVTPSGWIVFVVTAGGGGGGGFGYRSMMLLNVGA